MAPHKCDQSDNIAEIQKAIFKGNGSPSILSQLAVGNEKFNEIDRKLNSIMAYGRAVIIAVLGLIAATAWDMVKKHNAETYSTSNKTSEVRK